MSGLGHKQKTVIITTILIALVAVASFFVYLKYRGVSASERYDKGKVIWQSKLAEDINGDGKVEKLFLTSYDDGRNKTSVISTAVNSFRYRQQQLIGFEEDLAFCPKQYFKLDNGDIALCIFGEVGVHSENVEILRFSDFSTVNFVDNEGQIKKNMTTDLPYFDFDYQALDKIRIFFDNRDYDRNPLLDTIRSYYYLDDDVFHYNGLERTTSEGLIK